MIKIYNIKDIETGETDPYFSFPLSDNFTKESLDSYLKFYLNNILFCEVLYNADQIIRIRYFTAELNTIKKIHTKNFSHKRFQIFLQKENICTFPLVNIQFFYNEDCELMRTNVEYVKNSQSYSCTFDRKKKFINGEVLIYNENKDLKYALEYSSDGKLFNCFDFKMGRNIAIDEVVDIDITSMRKLKTSECLYELLYLI